MDVVDIEKALTSWAAAVLSKTVDIDIFRGGIPTGYDIGIGVLIGNEIYKDFLRPREYNVQILGKFTDRDDAMKMNSKLTGCLPIYGNSVGNIIFRVLSQRGDAVCYKAEDSGKMKWYASFNLLAVVLTSGAQV